MRIRRAAVAIRAAAALALHGDQIGYTMGLLDVPPAAGAYPPTPRQSRTRARALLVPLVLFIMGAWSLGVGVSNVVHAGEIASHGVRARAVVLANVSNSSISVGYRTASGKQERGTLDNPPNPNARIGSAITIVYDPSDPSIVALPGPVPTSDAWQDVYAGVAELLVALAILITVLVRARK